MQGGTEEEGEDDKDSFHITYNVAVVSFIVGNSIIVCINIV